MIVTKHVILILSDMSYIELVDFMLHQLIHANQ